MQHDPPAASRLNQAQDAVPHSDELPHTARRANASPHRLQEVDALRGVAAMAVVLFHYTTRFAQLYEPMPALPWGATHGHYGVNLFFIISGFVIFMTLDRTKRPLDFVVSRFSRLFPSYWLAIVLTYSITHWLGLPGKLVDWQSAFGNITMIQGLMHIPHVDGVYWTLEVELLFYAGMFTLYRIGLLNRIHAALLLLLALRITYVVFERLLGIDLPWTVSRLLILNYLPWFAIGIAICLYRSRSTPQERRHSVQVAMAALVTLCVAESLWIGLLACVLAACVFLGASGKLPWLRHPVLVWLGSISYPLYLLHENIGWSIQLQALRLGVPLPWTVLLALLFSLTLATAVTRWVEQPCMAWIRKRYREQLA